MNKIIDLYLSRKDVPTRLDVVQGSQAPGITFVLRDYEPSNGATARIFIKKRESEVYNTCTLNGNEVTYNPTVTSFDEPGKCTGQLEIVSGGKIAVSYRLYINVEPNIVDSSAIEATDDFSALQDAILAVGDISEYKEQTTTNTSDIAGIKNKTDKITFASGITNVNFGNANNTEAVYVWGNGTNKVGIGAYNTVDAKRFNLLARPNLLFFNDETDNVYWTMRPEKYLAGETVSFSGGPSTILAAHVTNSAKTLDFTIPLRRSAADLTCTLTLNASNGLSVRTGPGGYLNGSQYINTTTADYTITATPGPCGVNVRITSRTAYTGVVNNTACTVEIRGTLTFA